MNRSTDIVGRRSVLRAAGGAVVAMVAMPALAAGPAALPRMTDGPFYPTPAWRTGRIEGDADLTRIGASATAAQGEHLELAGRVVDAEGRAIDGAAVEIWQCDALGRYRHPRDAGGPSDPAFQGFGATTSARDGGYAFRTIRPVPYTGRTPHIHVKLRHPAFGEWTSQLFVAGDAGNERDFLWRQLDAAERDAVTMRLVRAPAGSGVAWRAERSLVVG